jgi:hypothetical protein
MKTAFHASRLAVGAFIVPYIICINPALILINTSIPQVALIIVTSLFGIFGLSAALEGYLKQQMNPIVRIIMAIGGILLIYPGWITDLSGFTLITLGILWQFLKSNGKEKTLQN